MSIIHNCNAEILGLPGMLYDKPICSSFHKNIFLSHPLFLGLIKYLNPTSLYINKNFNFEPKKKLLRISTI